MEIDFDLDALSFGDAALIRAAIYRLEGTISWQNLKKKAVEDYGAKKFIFNPFPISSAESSPGAIGPTAEDGVYAVTINLFKQWPRDIGRPSGYVSIEELVFHEVSHVALGHLDSIINFAPESYAVAHTNSTLRQELTNDGFTVPRRDIRDRLETQHRPINEPYEPVREIDEMADLSQYGS